MRDEGERSFDEFVEARASALLRVAYALCESMHDAEDVLATIDVPVAIVTADKDLMTPPATAEHIHRAIAGSRLVVIRGGTHYTPVEYPAVIADELGRLLDRSPGWERKGRAA